MCEIAGVISARGRAAFSLGDLFSSALTRAQIFTHSADDWHCGEGAVDELSTSATPTGAALGVLVYNAAGRAVIPTMRHAFPIVLKGRIANFRSLKKHLIAAGCGNTGDDEQTVVVRLLQHHLMKGKTTLDAARAALSHLQGFIAFIAAPDGQGNALIAASNGAELFLGFDQHEALAFSDQLAVRARDAMIALRTGDVAMLSADRIAIVDVDGMRIEKRSRPIGMIAPAAAGG
jgi:glutamine phosphoribosylpyrophosphate amidotransferase